MKTLLRIALMSLLVPTAFAEDPLSDHTRSIYDGTKKLILRSVELMPEEKYGYRPVESVRTYGQIVGHIADSQYAFCSAVLEEKNPAPRVEKTKTTKAGLIAALHEAFAYCDRAYASVTDTTGSTPVKFFLGQPKPKLGILAINTTHSVEHYGNLVTYLRMQGIVPPTSDPEFMKQLSK